MTGNAINAKSDELSSEELDAVFGGWFCFGGRIEQTSPGVRTIRPKCFNRLCSNSPAGKRAGCG